MKHTFLPLTPSTHAHSKGRERGITLIESLIALVVSALGVLGVVGVQMRTLADAQTTVRRAQAIRLIEDLSERMRVNPNAQSMLTSYVSDWNNNPTLNDCSSGCSRADLISHDVAAWKQSVQNNLPLGRANIFLAPGESGVTQRNQVGVAIAWRENERFDATTEYKTAVDSTTNDGGGVTCPTDFTCHLQYIVVAARCSKYEASGADEYFCSGS